MDKQTIALVVEIVVGLESIIVKRNVSAMRYECTCCERRANFMREFEHEPWCIVFKIKRLALLQEGDLNSSRKCGER